MINGNGYDGFALYCDYCGDECNEAFGTFQDAVDYKADRGNGWASVKDKDGDWQEVCPSCNTPEIIARLKGTHYEAPESVKADTKKLVNAALADFEGF